MKCSLCGKRIGEDMEMNYYTIKKEIYGYDVFNKVKGYKEIEVKKICEECYKKIFQK